MFKTFTADQLAHLLRTEAGDTMTNAEARAEAKRMAADGLFHEVSEGVYAMTAKGNAYAEGLLAQPNGKARQ